MEPDNDPQEHALELSQEKSPETAPTQVAQDTLKHTAETAGVAAAKINSPGRPLYRRLMEMSGKPFVYLKGFLQTGGARLVDAGKGLMQRLRNRGKPSPEEDRVDKRHDDKSRDPGVARKKTEPPPTAEAPKAVKPRSPVRSFFLYLLVLIIGGIAGMTFSFALFSKIIANQAEKIGDQRDEIAKIETQLSRTMESEAKFRLETMESKKKLSEVENRLNAAIQNSRENTAPTETRVNPTAPAAAVKSPGSVKSGDCVLASGKIGDNLARCINSYNRK